MDVPVYAWLAVLGAIVAMLAIDLFAHRRAHVIGVGEALAWSIAWVLSGITFGVVIWSLWGAEYGQQYFAGYVIEKSLAVDNVFVWAIIFAAFAVPRELQHRVLFLGVLGALVFRGIFIAAGAVLIQNFSWILYVFAAFLILTGVQMLRTRNAHIHPERSRTLWVFKRLVPMTDAYYGQRFVVRKAGVLVATPLLAVLVLVEVTDIVFAVDSIPAIFAVTSEPFLVFTANAFAILGLRAMYFLLADLIHRFIYLKIGLALVLVFVGIKMALLDVLYIPTTVSLAVVATIIAVAIGASLLATRGQGRRAVEATSVGSIRSASEDEIAQLEPIVRRGRADTAEASQRDRPVVAVVVRWDDPRPQELVQAAATARGDGTMLVIDAAPSLGFTTDAAVADRHAMHAWERGRALDRLLAACGVPDASRGRRSVVLRGDGEQQSQATARVAHEAGAEVLIARDAEGRVAGERLTAPQR